VKKSYCLLIFLFWRVVEVNAQVDPHFSQFYAYPLWLNPGMAGVMDGDYRITGVYRNQWSNVMIPFTTAGVSIDGSTGKKINLGASFMSQSAGDAGYKYLTAYATIAYSGIRFGQDENQLVIAGMQFGLLSRRFDLTRFQFGDQWNSVTGYDPGVTTADAIVQTSSSVFDIGAGFSYFDARPGRMANLFGGFGAFHLTQPEDPFINVANNKERLPVRYTFHAGMRLNLSDMTSLTPNILYIQQGNSSEKMIGLFAQQRATEHTDLLLGVNYRFKDAISPYLGVSFQNFVLGISYDINTSELGKAVTGTNSMELSFTYIGRNAGKPLRYLSCPRL